MTVTSFRTTDVDEANSMANQVFYESHVEPVRNSPFAFRFGMKFDTTGPITSGVLSHGCEISAKVGGLDMTYSVGVPLKGTFSMQFGNEDVAADPFSAVVCTPASHVSYRGYRTGTERLFVLSFDREMLHNELRMILGRDRIGTIKLSPSLDLRTGLGAQWWQMTSILALALQTPNSLASNPMMSAQLSSAIMTGLLLATDHPHRDELDAWSRPIPPATIRKAIEIIETRAHEPLTIPEIAAEIGCSATALQAGYRKHMNMTPREHLGRVRMERAHMTLKLRHPGSSSVAEIAALWGFRHPGRFAVEYRKIYGVSPNRTLRDD